MQATGKSSSTDHRRVLIVDDRRESRASLRAHLERMGNLTVIEVAGGRAAVTAAKRHRPHLILVDMHMPGMNGYETTRAIRSSSRDIADIPIIALTTACFSREIERCTRAGASDYIATPLSAVELLRSKVLFWSGLGHDESVRPPTVATPTNEATQTKLPRRA